MKFHKSYFAHPVRYYIECVSIVVLLEHLSGIEIHVVHATRFRMGDDECVCVWVHCACITITTVRKMYFGRGDREFFTAKKKGNECGQSSIRLMLCNQCTRGVHIILTDKSANYLLLDLYTGRCTDRMFGRFGRFGRWHLNKLNQQPVNTGSHLSHRYQIKILFNFNFPSTSRNTLNLFSCYIKIDFNLFFFERWMRADKKKLAKTHTHTHRRSTSSER